MEKNLNNKISITSADILYSKKISEKYNFRNNLIEHTRLENQAELTPEQRKEILSDYLNIYSIDNSSDVMFHDAIDYISKYKLNYTEFMTYYNCIKTIECSVGIDCILPFATVLSRSYIVTPLTEELENKLMNYKNELCDKIADACVKKLKK